VRDSLSALDQAIACCGSHLQAKEVRSLLGSFGLEQLETVSQALLAGDPGRMLEVVDELERNGHNLQHFSRELSRYFRNLLVARITGPKTRLIAASAAEREKMAETGAKFSEEDLTRYLQLSLDLFSDLQTSLQPRFHLEMGLVRLVQAGKLLPIEQALASISSSPSPSTLVSSTPRPAAPPAPPPPAPKRAGPSPFEQDRARKAAEPPPAALPPSDAGAAPQGVTDWRSQLHAMLVELGMQFTADAVEHSTIVENKGELQFTTSPEFRLALTADDLQKAITRISSRPYRIKVIVGAASDPSTAQPSAPALGNRPDQATERALSNPEVRRFREVFGGEVRKVRDLKE
jgi:DNA polymerase-3 subunit gamma/tau